jgi:hypothetical protein
LSLNDPSSEMITAPVADRGPADGGTTAGPATAPDVVGAKLLEGVPGSGDSGGAPVGRASELPPGIVGPASGAPLRISRREPPWAVAPPMRMRLLGPTSVGVWTSGPPACVGYPAGAGPTAGATPPADGWVPTGCKTVAPAGDACPAGNRWFGARVEGTAPGGAGCGAVGEYGWGCCAAPVGAFCEPRNVLKPGIGDAPPNGPRSGDVTRCVPPVDAGSAPGAALDGAGEAYGDAPGGGANGAALGGRAGVASCCEATGASAVKLAITTSPTAIESGRAPTTERIAVPP